MFEPVGPLRPAVYWRRRVVTSIVLVVAVAMILWIVSRLAAAEPGSGSPAAGSSSTSAASEQSEPSASSEADAPGTPADQPASEAAEQPADPPVDSAADSPTTQPPEADPAPPAPEACAPEAIMVSVAANANDFPLGSKPRLILSVHNVADQPCFRDLNAAGQEITVLDTAGNRMWSSNDCYPETSDDTRLINPGQWIDFTVVWSGKVSEPTCTSPRPLLEPGQYFLQAAQDGVASELVPFSIV